MLVVTVLCRRAPYRSVRLDATRRLQVQPRKPPFSRPKKILTPDTLTLGPVSEIRMKLLQSSFEEQVEEICLADSGGPGLGSVRQSLFVLIDQGRKLA